MSKDVIELGLAIALLCILAGIGFAIWSVAVAITTHANVASRPVKVVLANDNSSLKLEVELSGSHIWPLKVELSNDHSLDVRLEPGKLQVELENGIGPLEVKAVVSRD